MLKNSAVKIIATLALLSLLAALLPAGPAGAQGGSAINEDINKAVGDLEIPRGTTVNGDVTLNIGELSVFGIVNGNIKSNMGQITVNGDVNGNVETNMGQVVIAGSVSDSVKTRMGEVTVSGSVGGNLYSDLGAIRVDGLISGDIESGFGEMVIGGTVGGDIFSKGGNILITGIVRGDVMLEQGVVELGPDAVVSGRVKVDRGTVKKSDSTVTGTVEIGEELSGSELEAENGSPGYSFEGIDENFISGVAGRIVREVDRGLRDSGFIPRPVRDWRWMHFPFTGLYGRTARGAINMLIMFALAALVYTLFPAHVKSVGAAVSAKTGPAIGWGLLAVFLAVPLMVILAITIIGIPLIIVEIIFLAAAALLGYTGIALFVGRRIIGAASSRQANPLGSLALGVVILGLVAMIPLVGGLVSLALLVLSIGTALTTRFGTVSLNPAISLPPAENSGKNI